MFINETEIQKNVINNLNYIIQKFEVKTQREMADNLGVGPAQLTRVMHGDQTPSVYPFLTKIKELYNYSIDEFLFTNIREMEEKKNGVEEDLPVASYMKFVGLYQTYYFDTSSFKGRERSDDAKALKSGLLLVRKDPGSENKYQVVAVFNMKKEYADTCYEMAMQRSGGRGFENIWQYMISLGGSNHVYYGEMELSSKFVYISLRFENTKDRVQMIFHRPVSNSNKYIGGLGTIVSVSKGRNTAPCVQYIALSEVSLNVSEEEIAAHLLMHYPNLKTYDATDELVEMLVKLYQDKDGEKTRLTDEQKKTLVRNHIDKIVNETVERNLFRTVVVSAVDDDDFYHYIKRVKRNMR